MELFQLEKIRRSLRLGDKKEDIRERFGVFSKEAAYDNLMFEGISFAYYGSISNSLYLKLDFEHNKCVRIELNKESVLIT